MALKNRRSLKKGRSGPATDNKTQVHAAVESSLSSDAIDALQIVRLMSITSVVTQKRNGSSHTEIRGLDNDGIAFVKDKTGVDVKKCMSRPEQMQALKDLFLLIPEQFTPKKWKVHLYGG